MKVYYINSQNVQNAVVAKMELIINSDSSKLEFFSNQSKYYDHTFNILEYKGNLLGGICNLIGKPKNSIIINKLPTKNNYIKYNINVHNEFEFEFLRKSILNYLEKTYSFSLRETNLFNSFDSWKFILIDSTKLPRSNLMYHLNSEDIRNRIICKSSALLMNDTVELKSSMFHKVLQYAEIISGYYCDSENIGYLDLNIPLNVFKDIDSAKKFFNPYGIDIIWSKRDAKVTYLIFFD